MVLEIADEPDATMDEEHNARLAAHLRGLHDVELHVAAILADCPFRRRDAGHVDSRLGLESGENLLRFWLRQLPEGAAVLIELGEKRSDLRIDPRIGCGVGGRGDSCVCHDGCSKSECGDALNGFHDELILVCAVAS
jgi:hypothetical protein